MALLPGKLTDAPSYPLHLGQRSVLDDAGKQVVVEMTVGIDGIVRAAIVTPTMTPPTVLP